MTHVPDPYPPPGAAVPGAPPPLHRQNTAAIGATDTAQPPAPTTARIGRRQAAVAGAVVVVALAVGYLVLSRHRRQT